MYNKDGFSIEERAGMLIFNLIQPDGNIYGVAFSPPLTIEALYYGFKNLHEKVKSA